MRACDSKQKHFSLVTFFCCFRQKKVTRRFSGGSFWRLILMLLERYTARPKRRGRGSRRSYPGETTPLRPMTPALQPLCVPWSRLTSLLQKAPADAARPLQRGRGLRRSYPGETTPLRPMTLALQPLRVPWSRLTSLLQETPADAARPTRRGRGSRRSTHTSPSTSQPSPVPRWNTVSVARTSPAGIESWAARRS